VLRRRLALAFFFDDLYSTIDSSVFFSDCEPLSGPDSDTSGNEKDGALRSRAASVQTGLARSVAGWRRRRVVFSGRRGGRCCLSCSPERQHHHFVFCVDALVVYFCRVVCVSCLMSATISVHHVKSACVLFLFVLHRNNSSFAGRSPSVRLHRCQVGLFPF